MPTTEQPFSLEGRRVWVAGHRGMVGSALMRRLASEKCTLLTVSRDQLDLRRQSDVEQWMRTERPDVVFMVAARVGGILANDRRPADFLTDNLILQSNIAQAAVEVGVRKFLFLGSSCIYPRLAPQPIREDALLTGPLEPTNQWYAIAKIAGLMQCQAYRLQHNLDFISAMPTNLYGPGDNFDPEGSHVLPAFLRRFHLAKQEGHREVTIWGSGTPRREFLHVDDCADALVFIMKNYSDLETINVGAGVDIPILDLARLVAEVVGYKGEIALDRSKPDGTPRKLLDLSKLTSLGWAPQIRLRDGLEQTYRGLLSEFAAGKAPRGFRAEDKASV
ncbi:MAG TPA: GDP-L-fucose synthase [Acetobacteraceae bacterium]|jgi:GDP-L-fucose synthase|nr:GDP-L-fucose synthase [Acetobacteraceae bacterium]